MIDDLPEGFSAGATGAALKKAGRDDLGLVYSDRPCVLGALFTQNLFRAAPVRVCQEILATGGDVRAIVANSGQANSCTGEQGLKNCEEIQKRVAAALDILPSEVLPISTGVIGQQFDMDKWRSAIPALVKSLGSRDAEGFTRAFMTTDAFPKFVSQDISLQNGKVRLTVMAKGAGMICPNMATMLCVVLTDALVERQSWQEMFRNAVNMTFNRVSVDGDTSTNDTILGLANGASGVALASGHDESVFRSALTEILGIVAHMLVKDGEGAKRVIHIAVSGAASDMDAAKIARAVGSSQLVKTAVYGGDANWGRIINAIGYAGVALEPADVTLGIGGIKCFKNGQPVKEDCEEKLASAFGGEDVFVDISVGSGPGQFTLEASDLGHEYVTLNADYRS